MASTVSSNLDVRLVCWQAIAQAAGGEPAFETDRAAVLAPEPSLLV